MSSACRTESPAGEFCPSDKILQIHLVFINSFTDTCRTKFYDLISQYKNYKFTFSSSVKCITFELCKLFFVGELKAHTNKLLDIVDTLIITHLQYENNM